MSVNSTNPSTLFGGTWEALSGRFLLGAGANDANTTNDFGSMSANTINRSAGEKGGEATHTLTVNEMPSHLHATAEWGGTVAASTLATSGYFSRPKVNMTAASASADSPYLNTSTAGGSQAHNNMPPYLVVYIWKRVS